MDVIPRPLKDQDMPKNTEITISVPAAGKRLAGLSRNGSYAAAARGEIPTIKIGRLLALERMIERASEPKA
jgi:hypothetical protein